MDRRSKCSRTFQLAPGTYTITATLRIKRTRVQMQRSVELEVPDFLARGIGFGSPTVLMLPPGAGAGFARPSDMREAMESGLATPDDMSLALFERRPAVRFRLFLDADVTGGVGCDVFYEALGPDGRQVLYGKHRVTLTGGNDTFIVSFNVDDWDPGAYRINLRALTEDPVRDASASVVLNVDVTRAMLGRNFDDTLEILSLIASRDELEGLRDAPPEGRAEAWSEFWAARDPEPATVRNEALEEHLRRVRHVMKEFSNVQPGWRTDRGRVYIRYGPPDRIERATDSRYQGEYEIWRYLGVGRVFVFYDMFGLGDYRLVQGDMF
jgi:GWxTD domain-containing protein